MVDKIKEALEKLKWTHVVLIVFASAAFFYFTLDQSEIEMREQSVVEFDSEIQSLEKKIQEATEFEKQYAEKRKRFKELADELQKIQGALPKQFFLPDLLSDLLREAKQLEIEIISIKPDSKEQQNELYNSLGFSVEARGTFLQMFIFMDRLANMKRLVSVDEFMIQRDSERETVTLGGDQGVFAATKLAGGRAAYPGVRAAIRIITYRYRGSSGGGS